MEAGRIRAVIGKIGLDGHERGARLIARSLCDAGVEVIYTGIRQSVDKAVATVIQEDADILGLSFLAGDHMVLLPKLMDRLRQTARADVRVLVGGIILQGQIEKLLAMGVEKVFLPGTPVDAIVAYVKTPRIGHVHDVGERN